MQRIFFSVDAHGSTSVWRKWLKVPEIYNVDVLMLCGDLTGKVLVPIIKQDTGNYIASYFGRNWELKTEDEINEMEKRLAGSGAYSLKCDKTHVEELKRNQEKVEMVMLRKIKERMKEWMDTLVKKVDTKKVQVMVMPGNDDYFEIDPLIKSYQSEGIVWCLDEVIDIAGLEMISLAYVNPTRWNTARETDEKTLGKMAEELINKLNNPKKAIFNFHCPPYGTRLDLAPELDRTSKPVVIAGEVNYNHVGSKSLRKIVEKYQPMLYLHGHIHESPGVEHIGRTIVINPGSEYSEGILKGYVIEIEDKEVRNYYKVEG